ncbi:Septin-domain-containing protein [Xylaria castorea]|nr:Septin-domain-containing protein [Xylaria castorea]
MRPLHGDDTWATRQRQRAARLNDRDAHPTTPSVASNYVSFCITDEASLDSRRGRSVLPTHSGDPKKLPEPSPIGDQDHLIDDATSCSPLSRASLLSQSPVSLLSQAQPSSLSRPITPIMLGPSCISFTGSSSSSRRNSFTSSLSDDALGYDRESSDEPISAPSMPDSGSAPQFVMPSINMPSRRPFTETGKSLGRLKILLAGDSGVGKTSLLKAIVQTCDHIVHVDPISPVNETSQASSRPDIMSASSRRQSLPTTAISEVHASTKPYPEWWHELDTPSASHKRKRRDDHVLERNICFVDTPGYSRQSSVMETIMSCVDYVESHLSKVLSDDLSESELMNMLGGDGGCQVDAVLYLVSHSLKPTDLEYIRRLAPLTNVIPILSRAELLSEQQTAAYKQRIATQLEGAGIRPFTFTPMAAQEKREPSIPSIPYTASSVTGSDYDTMDASLLMSSDYLQPLMPTDLSFLVGKIFSVDGASWLRHSAAKKYLQWRESTPHRPRDLYRPLAPPVPDCSSALTRLSQALTIYHRPQQGDAPAQFQMTDWAAELQRSSINERLRYEALSRGERAVWLTEKLHECVQDGTLVAASQGKGTDSGGRRRGGRYGASKTQQHQDPLGLLQVAADLKATGWKAVEVLSSLGLVGLAFWISRHGWPTKAVELVDEWMGF